MKKETEKSMTFELTESELREINLALIWYRQTWASMAIDVGNQSMRDKLREQCKTAESVRVKLAKGWTSYGL